jgi:hypothetical protein
MPESFGMNRNTLPRIAALLLVVGSVSGCASWQKPGVSDAMTQAQIAHCKAIAYARAPEQDVSVMTSPGGYSQGTKDCLTDAWGHQSCTETPSSFSLPSFDTKDVNGDARDAIFDECMYRSGWTQH